MKKIYLALLFTITLTVLFGLLTLPALASEAKAPVPTILSPRPETWLSASLQITFTSDYTVYVPVVIKPANTLQITALVYDAQDEYVTIKNNGPGAQSFNGWQLVSVVGPQTYNFPDGITLDIGQTVRVHTGPGAFDGPPSNLLWSTAYIWNNDGDKAELSDSQGAVVASFCYKSGCP